MIRVSVVTLAYNSGNKVIKSIESILKQDYNCIEIIVADDGTPNFDNNHILDYIHSSDRRIISDKNVIIYSNSNNLGTVKNIDKAYNLATGEIIINLSAGDIFASDNIVSRIVEKMQSDKIDFLVTRRLLYRDNTSNIIRKIPDDYEIMKISAKLNTSISQNKALYTGAFYNMASGSVWAVRKKWFISAGGFDKRFFLWEDGPFMAKMTKLGKVINVDYSIESIYYKDGGVSNSKISDKMKNDVCIFLNDALQNHNSFSKFERRLIRYRLKKINNSNSIMPKVLFFDCWLAEQIYRCKRKIYNLDIFNKKRV